MLGFGIVQLLVGAVCALMLLGVVAGPETPATASSVFVFGMAAFHFVTAGVGSIRGRRWARAMSLVVAALWLAAGVVTTLAMLVLVPKLGGSIGTRGVVGLALSVAVPALLVGFYRRDEVRLECERRDPRRRWTDRVPAPVLALVLVMGSAAAWLLVTLSRPAVPLFGTVVTGAPAALTLLALAVLCAFLAVQLYRLKESAWWTVVLLQIAGCSVAAVTISRGGGPLARDPVVWLFTIATWVGYLLFLLWVRRYFTGARAERAPVAVTTT